MQRTQTLCPSFLSEGLADISELKNIASWVTPGVVPL